MPNTPDSVSTKKRSGGCFLVIFIVFVACLWGSNNLRKAEEKRAAEKQRSDQESAEALKLAEARKIKMETPATEEDFPKRVEEVVREKFDEAFRSVTSKYCEEKSGWEIVITAGSVWNNRSAIQQQMKEIAGRCFSIKGQSISSFKIRFLTPMTDGLGNNSEGQLVACHLVENVIPQIKWGNGDTDTWILDFNKIFETDYVAKSFASEWLTGN